MKQRIYLDTSVIGGAFDEEFKQITTQLFEMTDKKKFTLVISSLTLSELDLAPTFIKDFFNKIERSNIELISASAESELLANYYISEKVVGQTSFDDCHHIAIATISKVDILVSWNFKHIVNVFRIRGYNSVNLKLGYSQIEIRSPQDIIEYETGK
ncbi:MAG: PIN domain-containing protein [Chitinophagia bacterium]|jgi:predicted nucleic acid-binding protein